MSKKEEAQLGDGPIVLDSAIFICQGCRKETPVQLDRPIVGAEEIQQWVRKNPQRSCPCGASHYSVKFHIMPMA